MNICGKGIKSQGRLVRLARLAAEGFEFLDDPEPVIDGLRKSGTRVDLFTFMQKLPETLPKYRYPMEWGNFAALPISSYDHWWTKRFGKRVTSGSCMKCLSTAANTQVHECGQCHWQMCRRCWDLDNGQCRKCAWMPEGLPEPLSVLIAPTRAVPRRSSRTVVAGQGRQQR